MTPLVIHGRVIFRALPPAFGISVVLLNFGASCTLAHLRAVPRVFKLSNHHLAILLGDRFLALGTTVLLLALQNVECVLLSKLTHVLVSNFVQILLNSE